MSINHTAEDERRMIVEFLRAEASKYDNASLKADTSEAIDRLDHKSSVLYATAVYIERGDHEMPAARGDV